MLPGNQSTMSTGSTATTVIGRLRVRASRQDSLLTQMRIGRLLDPIELRPKELPSCAILYIRQLRDPLPGSLRLESGDVRPQLAWQEALNATLERLASKAVRPARETVPPSAEAVVFIDRSELLSSLASDWCEGSMMTRWWWQSLLKQGAATQIVKELWRREPEYVPAALEQLARKHRATDFVRALSDWEARELWRGVAQSFALPALASILDNFQTPAQAAPGSLDHDLLKTAGLPSHLVKTPPAGPWRPWVPECNAAALRPEQELFLGLSLMLQRAPVKARAPEFQERVRDWQQKVSQADAGVAVGSNDAGGRQTAAAVDDEAGSRQDAARTRATESTAPAPIVSESTAVETVDQTGSRSSRAEVDDEHRRRRQTAGSTKTLASPLSTDAKTPPPTAATDSRTWKYESEAAAEFPESEIGPGESAAVQDAAASSDPYERFLSQARDASPDSLAEVDAESEREERISTELGGVFYLINLGLFLGLYGDFTTPDEPGIQLSIWDFVALLGRELAGAEIESDDVWPLLERLAQREAGEPIGSGFDPDTVSSFEFQESSSEFRVSSFELEQETTGSEFRVSSSELNEETVFEELETRNSKLETWIARLLPYVRVRLQQALGLSEDEDPGAIVCRHQARVCVTPTHLDVYLSLAELPIAVRLSGLDRDPGWVPAAGRYIAFHFE